MKTARDTGQAGFAGHSRKQRPRLFPPYREAAGRLRDLCPGSAKAPAKRPILSTETTRDTGQAGFAGHSRKQRPRLFPPYREAAGRLRDLCPGSAKAPAKRPILSTETTRDTGQAGFAGHSRKQRPRLFPPYREAAGRLRDLCPGSAKAPAKRPILSTETTRDTGQAGFAGHSRKQSLRLFPPCREAAGRLRDLCPGSAW